MSSTNKTTHYNLSQYVANDKPTYLVDYNTDMSAIDSGIYEAKSEANTNTSAIGNLESLNTTAKTNLVGAINEVDGDVGTLSGTVGQHTTDIATNTANIGNLATLDTTAKNNLVSAVNEVDENIKELNLTVFKQYDLSGNTDITKSSINSASGTITIARNSKGTVFKIYGYTIINHNPEGNIKLINTGLTPVDKAFYIDCAAVGTNINGSFRSTAIKYNTDGSIEIDNLGGGYGSDELRAFIPCLYFAKNFGDTPSQS